MSSFFLDVRHALRSLSRSPGLPAVTVLTLAIGVGATTAIFSVLRAVVLRELPYYEPERLAVLWTRTIRQNLPDGSSFLNFRDWRERSREFQAMAAYVRPEFTRGTLSTGGASAERIPVGVVGPGFFEVAGTAPSLGRTFSDADFVSPARAVVISHALWQQQFAGDVDAIGRTVRLDGEPAEIIGVMPARFEVPTPEVQLWQPLVFGPEWQREESRDIDALVVLARLRPGATIASARTEMDGIAADLRDRYPATNAGLGVLVDSLHDRVVGAGTSRSLWVLFGSVACVLLIACANAASLLLARAAGRQHEFALRVSLGARRSRVARDVLTENLVLGSLAGLFGGLLTWLGTTALRNLAAGALPRADTIAIDARVLIFLAAAAVASGLLAGLLPAIQLATARPALLLSEGGPRSHGGPGRRRINQGLVTAEIALALVLLAGAGLLGLSFARALSEDRGFDSGNVLLLQVDLPATYDSSAKRHAFFSEAVRRIAGLPGVAAVGAIRDFFIHRQPDYRVALEGHPPRPADEPAPPLTEDQVVPGYFEAMRIPLVRGRLLQESDLAPGAPPVVVINEEMARRFWPGDDPIGRRFKYGSDPGARGPWKTVVGVVRDMRRQRLDERPIPCMFAPGVVAQMDIAVRTIGDPDALREAIRAEVRALDPAVPPYGMVTAEERLAGTVAPRRLQTMLLAGLAAVALVLAVVGAYAVVHQTVAARTREIGIRMALGADAGRVLRMVVAGAMGPAMGGLAIGVAGAAALSRVLSPLLYETNALDPWIYAAMAVLLLTVTTIACLGPAHRAARFDPAASLRRT
jgi:predicted permease